MKKQEKKQSFSKALSYEADREYLFKRSEKRAWAVSGVLGGLLVFSWVGMALMLPLKETVPYVIETNHSDGIPVAVNSVNPSTLSANQALDSYFTNHYIQSRESYTYQTIEQTYLDTQLYSDDQVRQTYVDGMKGNNAIDKIMGQGTISVKVESIITDKVAGTNTATARIIKTYTTSEGNVTAKHYVVRLSYVYAPQQKLKLSYRMDNPLGFYVTSYQIVEENI